MKTTQDTQDTAPKKSLNARKYAEVRSREHLLAEEVEAMRKGPLANDTIAGIVEQTGALAELPFPTHPHMLRHGTGYYLANKGVDTRTIQSYLGHRNIQHTVRYMELAPSRFKGLWDD